MSRHCHACWVSRLSSTALPGSISLPVTNQVSQVGTKVTCFCSTSQPSHSGTDITGYRRVHNGYAMPACCSLTLLGIPAKTCRLLGLLPRTDYHASKKRQVMADTRDTLHASRRARANGDHRPGCERRAPSRQPSYTRHQTRQAERRAFTATRLKYCRSTVGILSRIDRQATEHRGLAQGTHAAQKQSNVLSHNPAHFTDK